MDEDAQLRAHPNYYDLVDLFIDETYQRVEDLADNLRLRYVLANSEEEKNELTKKLLTKTKKKLQKFYGTIYEEIYHAIKTDTYFYDGNSNISVSIHHMGYYNLTLEYLDRLNQSNLNSLDELKEMNFSFLKPFFDFYEAIPLVSLYRSLVSLMNDISENESHNFESQGIIWYGSQTEFIELTKSLIENNNLRGTQKEIISKLSRYFGIEINHPDKLIQDIKKRNNGSETLFLEKLKSSLINFITK